MNVRVWTSLWMVWLGGSAEPFGGVRSDATQTTETLTVHVVAKEDQHVAIRGATVRLTGQAGTIAGISDEDGRMIVAVAPGSYRLQVLKPAYIPTEYGASEPGGRGRQLDIEGGRSMKIVIPLAKGGVIDGVIRGTDGMPAPDVIVNVQGDSGPAYQAWSDHRGHYRIYGLPPGDYLVSAQPPTNLRKLMYPASVVTAASVDATLAQIRRKHGAVLPSGPPAQPPSSVPAATPQAILGLVPVFYPGTMNPSFAEKVHLDEAEERRGIDMQLLASGTAKIRGTVVGFALSNTEAWVTALGQAASSYGVSARSKDGAFELLNLPPGHYTLRARATEPSVPSEPRSRPMTLSAFAEVDVVADVEGIVLTLGEAISITGRMAFGAGPGSRTPASVEVALKRLPSQEGAPSFSTRSRPDGSFALPPIEAGRYALAVGQLGPDGAGWFLQSVRVNGQERLGRPIDVSASAGDSGMRIVLEFSRGRTELVGVLRGMPAGSGTKFYIVAFPVDASRRDPALGGLAMTAASSDGGFAFTDLPGGEYFIAVISDPPPEWRTMDMMSALSTGAVMVRVTGGQRTIQDLQINR